MNKISLKKLDLDIYEEILDNGLKVYLSKIPRNTIHARMTTLFGGSVLEFKIEGEKYTKMPSGVAHFLEHKLFEKKDYDPTLIFEENGAMCNAFTTPFITSYYFSGTDKFYNNLNNLLKLVNEPYFTDENVLKEKGIISQEKKEDMDNPSSIVYDKSLKNTFKNLDYKNSVLGTLKDINRITKEDLYKCYNCFYTPNNMILTISGNIDIKKTISFIKKYYKNNIINNNKLFSIKKKEEPERVVKEIDYIHKNIKNKEIQINYKIKNPHMFEDEYTNSLYFSILLDMNFGGLSDIFDIAQKNSNFISSISSRITKVEDYYIINFFATIKENEKEAIEIIDKKFKNFDFDEKDFKLLKKAIINNLILSTEDSGEICNRIVNQIRSFGRIIDNEYEEIANLKLDTLKKFCKKLNIQNRSIVILKKAS